MKIKYVKLSILFFLHFSLLAKTEASKPWTWTYTSNFNVLSKQALAKPSITIRKLLTPSFTQCICSWNALRPAKGFYRFWIRIQYAKLKVWSKWYKMLDWGKDIACSYFEKDALSSYHHVRLEIDPQEQAHAYEVKIESCKGAPLNLLKNISVCISNFLHFKSEDPAQFNNFPSLNLPGLPLTSQMQLDHPKKEVLCSPTSCSIALSYMLNKSIDPILFAQQVFDEGLNAYGSWPFNTAVAFEHSLRQVRVERFNSFKDIYQLLKKNKPVVVSVRGLIKDAPQAYNQGHLLVVCGWDASKGKVLCIDPAWPTHAETSVGYDIASFLAAWERSRRLAYRFI